MKPAIASGTKRILKLLIALTAIAAATAGAETMVLRRGSAAEPPTLDPNLGAGTLAAPIIGDMVTGLLARGPDSRPQAACAESWTVSDDGRIYTFHLREGLKWSDGTPLTAEDFVYTFRRLLDPATRSRLVGVFFGIENARAAFQGKMPLDSIGVSAPDPRTVEFRLEQPTPFFIELIGNLQIGPVPRHVIEKHGRSWTKPGIMVTNGPYMLDERVPQSYIKLVKNPYFFDADTVRIDEVYWQPTQNLATSMKQFRAGEMDIVLNYPPSEVDWIRENIPESLHITPSLGTYFMVINMREPPLDDVRIRKALYLAIDRETITDRLLRTGVRPAYSFAPPEFRNYDGITMPEVSLSFAERQAMARQLLTDAGYGPDKPLTFELVYDTQEENRKIMVAVAAMWQAVGVRAELTNVEFSMLNRKVRTRDYQVARWFYIASFDDAYAFLQLFLQSNPNNWPGVKSDEYDELLQLSNLETDVGARQLLLEQAEQVLMEQYPLLPISFYVGRRLISPRVKGWVDSPGGPTASRYLWLE